MYEMRRLTLTETCEKLGLGGKQGRVTFFRMRKEGRFFEGQKNGKNVYYLNNEVDIWLILSNDDRFDVKDLPKYLLQGVSRERLLEIKAAAEKANGALEKWLSKHKGNLLVFEEDDHTVIQVGYVNGDPAFPEICIRSF